MTSAISRREVLLQSAAAAGLAIGSRTRLLYGDDVPPADQDGWIDAHSHIWTRDIERFPLNAGQTLADLKPPSFTDEELMPVAEPENVRRVVLIQHHIYHGWDNSYLVDAARRRPDTFRVVGMVDDTQPHPDKAMRDLHARHVTGFRITPSIRGSQQWLEGPGMQAMWRCAADTRQAICCLINPGDLPAVDGMCARYPDTPVVIDHFARIGIDGQMRESDLNNLCELARHAHTHVKISAYYALGKKQPPYLDLIPMIRRLYHAFGPQRLMWASDCPYQLGDGHTYAASIGLVRDHLDFASAADRQWLLRKTAERVYFS